MHFFRLELYCGTYQQFLTNIDETVAPTLVFTPNPEILYRAYYDRDFMDVLKRADYNVPDGNGLYLAYMMQKGESFFVAGCKTFFHKRSLRELYGELIKWSDLTRNILESPHPQGQNKNEKVHILVIDKKIIHPKNEFERKKSVIQKSVKWLLEKKYPHVVIHTIFDGEMSPDAIAHYIELNHIRFVFSCLGMKIQEVRLVEIFSYLPERFPVVWLGVWASIDFLLGLQKRAPRVFQDLGLEWLYRLIMQPRIRAKRIKTALIDFPRLVKQENKEK